MVASIVNQHSEVVEEVVAYHALGAREAYQGELQQFGQVAIAHTESLVGDGGVKVEDRGLEVAHAWIEIGVSFVGCQPAGGSRIHIADFGSGVEEEEAFVAQQAHLRLGHAEAGVDGDGHGIGKRETFIAEGDLALAIVEADGIMLEDVVADKGIDMHAEQAGDVGGHDLGRQCHHVVLMACLAEELQGITIENAAR